MAYTTIDDPEAYFQVKVYTGNYTDATAITLDGDTDMQPDMVWIKDRSDTSSHTITDSVRGVTKTLYPNADTAEGTEADYVQAFGSDGFTVGANNNNNESGESNVAWCWKESATAGFDIVLYTGNGSNRTIAHGLSAKPDMIIAKSRSNVLNWKVGHEGFAGAGWTNYINMDETNAMGTASITWQDTAPTSSVWSLGDSNLNTDTYTYVAYLFAPKQGFSKFGSYTGNGNADGPFIYTGFKPAFVMVKNMDSGSEWEIYDNKRIGYNSANYHLNPSDNTAEATLSDRVDLLSNGFKIRAYNSAPLNNTGGGDDYIYMAFAEAPFVNSNGVPCNAR